MNNQTSIWTEVSSWPAKQRLALAARLLQSLQVEEKQVEEKPVLVSKDRQDALGMLIGIWKTNSPPTDEDVERILDQERMRKYG